MAKVVVSVVGLKLLSTPVAICTLVMILAAVESMERPEGALPVDVVGVGFVDVGVGFDIEVDVAAIDVVVASREETRLLPVCLRPW